MQADNFPSGNWRISYADRAGEIIDAEGLRVLCVALDEGFWRETSEAAGTDELLRTREAFRHARRRLGVTDRDAAMGRRLTFRQIIFFPDDLWARPRLVTFWTRGENLGLPIAENALGALTADLRAVFWVWFRRFDGEAVAPFPGGLPRKVKKSLQFKEFAEWVRPLCEPPRIGRPPGRSCKDGLVEAVRFVDDFMEKNPDADRRDVIRWVLGLAGSDEHVRDPLFRVVPRLPDDPWERSRVIVSCEAGERDKGDLVGHDKAARLVERHVKRHRR